MSTQKKYVQATDLEHMRNQTAMYLGGKAVITSNEYVQESPGQIVRRAVRLSPAALKCFDEILVNAVDQYTQHGSDIDIDIDPDYTCSVMNTLSSIEISETETRDGRRMYTPQLIFGEFRTSSNFNTDGDSITGGVFGTGAKGVNAFSARFEVETYDPKCDTHYHQVWENCMSTVHPPTLTRDPEDKVAFVRITFRLNFQDFGMLGNKTALDDFVKLAYMRALHTASFCTRASVFWNGEKVTPSDPQELMQMYLKPHYTQSETKPTTVSFSMVNLKRHKWTVTLGTKESQENLEQISVVNGIYVKGGTHIDHLVNQIVDYVKPLWIELKDPTKKASRINKTTEQLEQIVSEKAAAKDAKDTKRHKELVAREKELKAQLADVPKFDKRYIEKYIFLYMTGYINRPSFTGQRKDQIDSPQEAFADYRIPEARLHDFWSILRPWVEYDIFSKSAERTTRITKTKRVKAKKYCPAKWAGTAKRAQASLFIAEGDSAYGTIDKGISCKSSTLSYDRYGIFSIQGVPMNARKEITYRKNPKTGEHIIVRSKRLRDNERLTALTSILNLDYTKTYSLQAERDTLTYGHVILSSDQDEDGKGNIRSQLLNFFWTFWPELVRVGFVQFMITPVVRAFNAKETVREFFTERDYREWAAESDRSKWEIVYYKGLGSHGESEIENMFGKFHQLLITYVADKHTEVACEVYFGDNPDLRKNVLIKPPSKTEDQYYKMDPDLGLVVSATKHLNTETRSYQIYNISRHLKHVIDGAMPSRRKIWAGARAKLSHNNQRIKVYQLGGEVAKMMNYHHGDQSLYGGITGEAQCFPGAREFPMLLPLSNFGSRKKGGSDAGSARYTYTRLNKQLSDAMFPPADDYILEYTFDDGQRGEPVFYVPVVPLAILESYTSPGHGWTCVTWARDYWEVSARVRQLIADPKTTWSEDISFTTNRFRHRIEKIRGHENSIGTYRVENDTLIITELPVRVWNEHFLNGNPAKKDSKGVADMDDIVDAPVDKSTDTDIHIELQFRPGFLKSLPESNDGMDPIIKLLDLKQSLKPQLNLIGLNGAVQEFSRYDEIMLTWFQVRQQYYERRIERLMILLKLRIIMYRQQLQFIDQRETLGLSNKRIAVQNEILAKSNFIRINKTLLDRPSYTAIADLENAILRGPNASHDYLRKMNADDLSNEGRSDLETKLATAEQELAELTQPGALQKIQIKELDKLDSVVRKGQNEGWMAWETKQNWQ